MNKNKYGAKHTLVIPPSGGEPIRFDSQFESKVYQTLCRLIGDSNIELQIPLLVKPATQKYSEVFWKCDFRVHKPNNWDNYLNIEVKGCMTTEFKRSLKYLQYFSPDEYNRLVVVTSGYSRDIDKHKNAIGAYALPAELHRLNYLK